MANNSESIGNGIFRLEQLQSNIWKLVFDLPGEKVNKLSRKVMADFSGPVLSRLQALGKEGKIEALILTSGKPGQFLAGADIDMIIATKSAEEAEGLSKEGHAMMNAWEDLPFPTVAAI